MQTLIFGFCEKHNLHVILSDMLNKTFLSDSTNPHFFMADYLLKLNNGTIENHLQKKVWDLEQKLSACENLLLAVTKENVFILRRHEAFKRQVATYNLKAQNHFNLHSNTPSLALLAAFQLITPSGLVNEKQKQSLNESSAKKLDVSPVAETLSDKGEKQKQDVGQSSTANAEVDFKKEEDLLLLPSQNKGLKARLQMIGPWKTLKTLSVKNI